METKKDMVNHPSHYEGTTSLECIDTMVLIFGKEDVYTGCLFNAYKYLWRYKNKGNPKQDLEKAEWYLNKAEALRLPQSYTYKERLLRELFDKEKDNWYADNH